jgi:cytochrome c peroxidase
MKPTSLIPLVGAIALGLMLTQAKAEPARDRIIADLAAAAGQPLSAERGKALFMGSHTGGKPDTPSCTTCHTSDPHAGGRTRVGKPIDPMAVSSNASRFTDPEKVAKWFRRNCNSVLGRDCTATEQGDILTWLSAL